MRTTILQKLFALAFIVMGAMACQKELSGSLNPDIDTPVDLGSRVNASVAGFVTDENEAPVQNATVKFGIQTVTTNEYGYFEASNVSVPKNAAMVTVSHSGYFPGIRTFIAKEGKEAFVRIKLLPKTTSGTISAANGGNVTLPNGLKIALPENAVVNASTGAAYSGTIHVAAQWINPVADDVARIMPGDLRAIDADNNLKLLQTYGMAAVELSDGSGQKLQIATGKKATLTWPLPAAISGTAPATIPLWFFDEAIGLWKEEGTATKTGNTYVGDVSHFSFWNCDVPGNYVQIDMTVKTPGNAPIQSAMVRITDLTTNQMTIGYTDSVGYVYGPVPANTNLKIDITYGFSCGVPLHTQTVATTNSNLSLGSIIITNNTSIAEIDGAAIDCNGSPVSEGYGFLNAGGQFYRFGIYDGVINYTYFLCDGNSLPGNLIVVDLASLQQSPEIPVTIVPGINNLGTLQACGTNAAQFMNITVNGGTPQAFTFPTDSLNYFYNGQTGSTVGASKMSAGAIVSNSFSFNHTTITVGGTYVITNFYSSVLGTPNTNSLTVNQSTSSVNITEYGAVGEFIAGTYTIDATGPAPANTPYTITGNFRIRRYN